MADVTERLQTGPATLRQQ